MYNSRFKKGWYITGDQASCDNEGYFWFQGRADDVINTAGHLVGPFEVESMEALEEHVKTLVFDFHAARSRTSLFVLNDRFTRMPGEEQQPLSNLGENWGNISDGFKNTHQIYSNGYVKIFLSPNA